MARSSVHCSLAVVLQALPHCRGDAGRGAAAQHLYRRVAPHRAVQKSGAAPGRQLASRGMNREQSPWQSRGSKAGVWAHSRSRSCCSW